MGTEPEPRQLDRTPEVLGVVADLLIIVASILALGVFRC